MDDFYDEIATVVRKSKVSDVVVVMDALTSQVVYIYSGIGPSNYGAWSFHYSHVPGVDKVLFTAYYLFDGRFPTGRRIADCQRTTVR